MSTITRIENGQAQFIQLTAANDWPESSAEPVALTQAPVTLTQAPVALTAVQTLTTQQVGEPTAVALPPPNYACYQEPPEPKGETRWLKYNEPTITKTIEQNFNTLKTSVKENNIHHQHNRTVIQNVNRNHWHTQRVIVKDNNFHHYLTNNVIRVNDIHHQKIEQVRGEGKTFNDFKQTQRVEPAQCQRNGDVQQIVALEQPTQVVAVAAPTITAQPITLTAAPITVTGPVTRYVQQL